MAKRTALYDEHLAAGGKIVDFNGWDLPLNYASQIQEHNSVRENVGMFDVSHMAPVDIIGAEAEKFISYLLANNINKIAPGKAIYSCMLNESGGIVDDLITYWLADNYFRLVFNAGCYAKDLAWVSQQAQKFAVEVKDISQDMAIIALQGPQAAAVVAKVLASDAIVALKPFACLEQDDMLVGRTGYTGEDGFEFILPGSRAGKLWQDFIAAGVTPCGLGARDTLRLEAGMKLYGNDMDINTTPMAAGLKWTLALEPADRQFIGRSAIQEQLAAPAKVKMVGLTLEEKGMLRPGQEVETAGGSGRVTSGSFSPSLGKAIAFARVPVGDYKQCHVKIRDKLVPAAVGPSIFFKRK